MPSLRSFLTLIIAAMLCWQFPLIDRAKAMEPGDVWDRGCGDDDGNDRCAPDVQKKMRESYGIEDAAAMMNKGVTLRRAMLVDGYGSDVIAVTFSRRPGQSPSVEVRVPCAQEKNCPAPLTANITTQVWTSVINQSENFDQQLVREVKTPATDGEDEIKLCMHSWVVVAESVDAPAINQSVFPREMKPGVIRSDTEGACADGLAIPYAFQLADWALESLPECSGLDLDDFRNASMLLSACTTLGGDKIAAADAYPFVQKLRNIGWSQLDKAGQLFGFNSEARSAKFLKDLGKGRLFLAAPEAIDPNTVIAKGLLVFDGDDEKKAKVADIELKLVREFDSFVISEYTIGESKPWKTEAESR